LLHRFLLTKMIQLRGRPRSLGVPRDFTLSRRR
jgi:hypothetical protein